MKEPFFIDFQHVGNSEIGYISVAENFKNIPFAIQRVYWVYDTPAHVERGNHANRKAEHVLISLAGTVKVFLECRSGKKYDFVLDTPNRGLYIPPMLWRKLTMTPDVICLSLSSTLYEESDYIRSYGEFLNLR